ncbi:MAG: nitrate/nitrite transporter NrtS [Alphaproteobacteria bacterium]
MNAGPGAAADSRTSRPPLRAIVFEKGIVRRSAIVALIVGTVLNLIAQGDFLMGGAAINWWKVCLTYCVPYIVATYGACTARLEIYRSKANTEPGS